MLHHALRAIPAAALLLAPGGAAAFSITLDYSGSTDITDDEVAIFETVADIWEALLNEYAIASAEQTLSLAISVNVSAIDGVGNVLGAAGPDYYRVYSTRSGPGATSESYAYATSGTITFDSADVAAMEASDYFFEVALHEMAHVLGFGTLWTYNGVYTTDSGRYVGEAAVSAYQTYYDADATYVEVELDGSSGTANGHWDESWIDGWSGDAYALMTGYLNLPVSLSYVTVASFADLGFNVVGYDEYLSILAAYGISSTEELYAAATATVATSNVPLPASGALLAGAFGAFGLIRRRRAR